MSFVGGLEFYHLNYDIPCFNLIFGAYEHDDFITSLDIACDKSNLVTTSADGWWDFSFYYNVYSNLFYFIYIFCLIVLYVKEFLKNKYILNKLIYIF